MNWENKKIYSGKVILSVRTVADVWWQLSFSVGYDNRVCRIKVNKCPHVHYSNRTSAVSLQNEKETDKERPGTLAATAKWPGIDIPLYTAPTAPQWAHECLQCHHFRFRNTWAEDHVDACSATISVSGTRGLAEDHVHACSATISVSGTRGAEDHVHACKRHHFRFRNTWAGKMITWVHATSSASGTLWVPVRLLVE